MVQGWEKKFDEVALERGRKICSSARVEILQKDEGMIRAAFTGIPRYEASIVLREGQPVRMKCGCPKARGGSNCEHMAAALYMAAGYTEGTDEKKEAGAAVKDAEKVVSMADRKTKGKRSGENVRKKAAVQESAGQEAARKEVEAREAARQEAQAQEAARQEAQAREAARQETARRIAEREARKGAEKAERKRRREEAQRAAEAARQEEALRRQEEEKRLREEAARKSEEEAARKAAEEAARKAAEEEAARKKSEKIQAAIARKQEKDLKEKQETESAEASTAENRKSNPPLKKSDGSVDRYQYFDMDQLRKSVEFPPDTVRQGKILWQKGDIVITKFASGYAENYDGMIAEVAGEGKSGKSSFPVRMAFSREEVFQTNCSCPECRKRFYWYDLKKCPYMAGMIEGVKDYLEETPIGDATDRSGICVLRAFQEKHTLEVLAREAVREESLILEPRLKKKDGALQLTFRISAGKAFIIKDLFEFCRNVEGSLTATYGSSTEINHQLSNFTQRAREWISYIHQVVQEEQRFQRRLDESPRYYGEGSGKCAFLELYGWRLDEFFQLMGDEEFEYEEKKENSKEKRALRCRDAQPRISMQIRKNDLGQKRVFHGIDVSCRMPEFFRGTDSLYYVEKEFLCRADREFMEPVLPLADQANGGRLEFQVGRNKLSDFYYTVLPQLQGALDIMEEDAEEIHSYLPPEVQFVFYLDAEDHNITCRLHARYGERELQVFDILDREKLLEPFRIENREAEILHITSRIFPELDIARDELHCGQNEETMYQVLEHGVDTLMELGEVQCTERFRSLNVIRRVKASVGVSVSKGLLDLSIDTEDIAREELLEVLKSYRSRKTFHRLKNGSFLNLEDETLHMLQELMETMQISTKEFLKGKIHLPAFRSLYLDKLLEENEGIYCRRDSHFKKIVKNFKTVTDADFEEPASLSRIMRGYQKNGYKWMRTLETYGFGGILADDMGLGKTLQAVALLLAAKEEGREGTSLVICPASLVFNWGEEFARFAPALQVLLVTGGQEERRQKLETWQEYDVLVTSYDLLKRDIDQYEGKQFSYEIIDEAQYIKNHTTAVSKAVKVVRSGVRLALTGTPVENRLSELWSIFDYLMPGFLYKYEVFRREMETPIAKNGDEEAMARLRRMVGPFILRRLKGDVLKDLPDKLEETRYVKLDAEQRKLYDAQVVHMQQILAGQDGEDFNKNKLQILAELMRLRQICCDPGLCFEDYKGDSAKLESCLELIDSAIDGGHKLLVFSQFTTMLDILAGRLTEKGILFYTIKGDTPKEKRLQLVKAFNGDSTPVFLISLKAGGVGLNLTGADVVVHYDPWWNLAVQNQATDRAHRIGQEKKVTVYKLIVKNSVEEKIERLQEAKKDLAEQVVNAEAGQFGGMGREELLDLLECAR